MDKEDGPREKVTLVAPVSDIIPRFYSISSAVYIVSDAGSGSECSVQWPSLFCIGNCRWFGHATDDMYLLATATSSLIRSLIER